MYVHGSSLSVLRAVFLAADICPHPPRSPIRSPRFIYFPIALKSQKVKMNLCPTSEVFSSLVGIAFNVPIESKRNSCAFGHGGKNVDTLA
jgi:hypothetical protein